MSCTFLTGATGFVGAEVLARLLERPDREVIALIRAADPDGARARLRGVLESLGLEEEAERVHAVAGDVTSPRLGLTAPERHAICARIDSVVHCAASVSFTLGLEESRAINVEGSRRVVELAARAPGLERLVHVSTAYVAGRHTGTFGEEDSDLGQTFRNAYERSKWEAEAVVRGGAAAAGLPLSIVRPSIVVGDSESGWTASFNVVYHPLQAFARGLVDTVPADPNAIVDIVPVDHVAEGILAVLEAEAPPPTVALVAGETAPRLGELIELAARYFDRPPARLDGSARPDGMDAFIPYFSVHTRFGDANARALGLEAPRIDEYFDRLMDFAVSTRWGKRPIGRATARISRAA
jgi:long-chain acyl-CoA synthetase